MDDVLDALEGMVEQYLYMDDRPDEYTHYFMSAGEYACAVLAACRPDRWELTRIGVKRTNLRPWPEKGGHSPSAISPNPKATNIPKGPAPGAARNGGTS